MTSFCQKGKKTSRSCKRLQSRLSLVLLSKSETRTNDPQMFILASCDSLVGYWHQLIGFVTGRTSQCSLLTSRPAVNQLPPQTSDHFSSCRRNSRTKLLARQRQTGRINAKCSISSQRSARVHLSSDACVNVRPCSQCGFGERVSLRVRVSATCSGERDCCMDHEHQSIYL